MVDNLGGSPTLALYGVGFVAVNIAKLAHERGWPIVAAFNRAGPKVGQDLGELAGIGPNGVIIQDSETADFDGLLADVGIVSVRAPVSGEAWFPAYERLIKAGSNVIALGARLYDPADYYPEQAERLDKLARQNGVTFTGAGIWDTNRIWPGLLAVGTSSRIDEIHYTTLIEPLAQGNHWAPVFGIGMTLEEYGDRGAKVVSGGAVYGALGVMVLKHCRLTVSDTTVSQEAILTNEQVYSSHLRSTILPGRSIGRRLTVEVASAEGVTVHIVCEHRILMPGEVEHGTWTVRGVPNIEIRAQREDSDLAQANSVLNRVPDVLDAKPGIVPIMSMGAMRPFLRHSLRQA